MEKAKPLLKLRPPSESLILHFIKQLEKTKNKKGLIIFKKARGRLASLYSTPKEKIGEQIIFLQDLGFLRIKKEIIKLNYEVLENV